MKKQGKFTGVVKFLGDSNKKTLLEQKLCEVTMMSVELKKEEIGLCISAADGSSVSCGFGFDEWEHFVKGITEANKNLEGIINK